MKITATRRSNLEKQRDAYDADLKLIDDQIEKGANEWHKAVYLEEQRIEKDIAERIGSTSLNLEIRVQQSWNTGFEVRIEANKHNKFDDNVALAWNWSVELDKDGNIKKDSSSWSGLKAITADQIADLEESVRVIKILNNIDWADVLSSPVPKYSEFVDEKLREASRDKKKARPDFESDIIDARLEELIGTNIAVQLTGDEYYRGPAGILITGMTDKFLKGYIFPWSFTDGIRTVQRIKEYAYNDRRVAKTKIVIKDRQLVEAEIPE